MMNSAQRGSWVVAVVLTGAQLVSLPAVAMMAPVEEAKGEPGGFAGWRAQAEEQRAAGKYSASARSFASAYDALSAGEQAGLKGEITVNNAVDDFKLAQEQASGELGLLEEEKLLLEGFVANTSRKQVPQALADELERVRARLVEVRQAREEAEAEKTVVPVEERAVEGTEDEGAAGGDEPVVVEPEPPKRDVTGATLVGSGLVAVVGGASLIGGGIWMFGAADDRRDDQLAALAADEFEDETGIRDRLDDWHRRGRGLAMGLTVGGAVLAGVGIGLTTWGAIRLRRNGRSSGRRAAVVMPVVSLDRVGLAATVAF